MKGVLFFCFLVVVLVSVPAAVRSAVSGSLVGFSGSRSVVPPVLSSVLPLVPSSAAVLVGCARGVDAAVRSSLSARCRVRVFRASSFGSGRASFARRSAALVRSLSACRGVLVCFPGRACPAGVRPSSVFRGFGSGSWGSAALAVGLGVRVCLWLPSGLSVPAAWGLVSVGFGWWVSRSA